MTIYTGTFEDLYDFFALVRREPAFYPAPLLKATRAAFVKQVRELPFADGWCEPRYDYLGARRIISGGAALELLNIDPDEPGDEEMPY